MLINTQIYIILIGYNTNVTLYYTNNLPVKYIFLSEYKGVCAIYCKLAENINKFQFMFRLHICQNYQAKYQAISTQLSREYQAKAMRQF